MKKVINSKDAPQAIGPYSQAIACNGFLYVSGQLPVDIKTGEMPKDIKAQTHQALTNLKYIVEEAGATLADVVKATCFLDDIKDFNDFNEVYSEFFPANPPARSCFEVSKLPKDAGVEIEAIVALK